MSTSICTCKGKFRFELEGLHELFALLHFPQIVKLHNCTCTGEETFLYMLRRLSYRLRSSWHYTTLGGRQAAVRHDNVVTRRRRRLTTAASSDFFCVPFGGRANGRVSTAPTPSATTAARRRIRRLHLRLRLRGLLPPALPASCAHERRDLQLGFRRRLQRRRRPRLGVPTEPQHG